MNTRDFEYLVAVAEELHFGRAAERCNASQPALSGQLRKLEDRLGVQIFERTKRHVRVTEIGQRIVDRAHGGAEKAAEPTPQSTMQSTEHSPQSSLFLTCRSSSREQPYSRTTSSHRDR